MSDNIPDNVEGSTENAAFVQPQTDLLNSFMMVPVTKLDADQYMVTDLDGVTESLFGSGNMNFAMMQASQTDETIQVGNLFDMVGGDNSPISVANAGAGSVYAALSTGGFGLENIGNRPLDSTSEINGTPDSANGHGSQATVGSIGASALASNNTQSANPFTSVQNYGGGSDTVSTETATNGQNGSDGTKGSNGTTGADGKDGTGDGTTIIDIDITNNFGDDLLTTIVNNAGDIVTTITGDLLTTIVNNAGDITNNAVTNIFDTINNILDGGSLGPIGLNLNATLDDLTHLNLDIINGENLLNVVNETIDLSAVTTPLTDLLGNIAADLDLGVLLNPFQYDNSPGDTDLHVTTDLNLLGIDLLPQLNFDIPLDPVEGLLGDLDINLNISDDLLSLVGGGLGDLLGDGTGDTDLGLNLGGQLADLPLLGGATDILLNPVEDLLGDIDLNIAPSLDLLHLNGSETNNALGDTDIVIPLDIDLVSTDLLNNGLAVDLDFVESVTGDIDLDLGAAINAVGNLADSLINTYNGGSDSPNLLSPLVPDTNNGDTDLDIGLGTDLLGHSILHDSAAMFFGPVEDLMGDLDIGLYPDADILGGSQIDNTMGDSDLVIPLNIDLIDTAILHDTLQISLDPVESLTGDIDLTIPVGADLLGHASDIFEVSSDIPGVSNSLLDSIMNPLGATLNTALDVLQNAPDTTGGLNLDILNGNSTGLPLWTENTLPDAGSALGSGLGTDISHLIPDPVIISNVIPMVSNPVQDLGHSLSGGVRHFGGLFG